MNESTTVGDIIEFWVNWCEKKDIERIYGISAIDKGRVLIVDDPEYWEQAGMSKLLDAVTAKMPWWAV